MGRYFQENVTTKSKISTIFAPPILGILESNFLFFEKKKPQLSKNWLFDCTPRKNLTKESWNFQLRGGKENSSCKNAHLNISPLRLDTHQYGSTRL